MAEFDIIFWEWNSTLGCVVDLAEETGVIVRKGAWYSYNGDISPKVGITRLSTWKKT